MQLRRYRDTICNQNTVVGKKKKKFWTPDAFVVQCSLLCSHHYWSTCCMCTDQSSSELDVSAIGCPWQHIKRTTRIQFSYFVLLTINDKKIINTFGRAPMMIFLMTITGIILYCMTVVRVFTHLSACIYLFFFSWKYLSTAIELQQHEMASFKCWQKFCQITKTWVAAVEAAEQLSSFSGVNLEVAKRQNEPTLRREYSGALSRFRV